MKAIPKELTLQSIESPLMFEKEYEFDETLPDHLPNIKDSLCIESEIIKEEIIFENDKLMVEYTIRYKFFYISDLNDKMEVYNFTHNTTQRTEIRKEENSFYLIHSQIYPSSIRTLNPRKIFIKSKIGFSLTKVTQITHNTISDNQADCCIKTSSVASSCLSDLCVDEFIYEDEITLGDGYDPIGSILNTNATLSGLEYEVTAGYILLKGSISLSIIYSSEIEPKRVIRTERQIAFEKNLPCENADEGYLCICNLKVTDTEATAQIDSYGEYRAIGVKFKIAVDTKGIMDNYDAVVTDIFSPKYNENIIGETIKFTKLSAPQEKILPFEGLIGTGETLFNRIISAKVTGSTAASVDSNDLNGELNFIIIGETAEGVSQISFQKDFTETLSAAPIISQFEIIECNVTIAGGNNLSYKALGKLTTLSAKDETLEIIKDVEFTEFEDQKDKLIIYYPSENEAIWDIAKKYHVSPDDLKTYNPSFSGETTGSNEAIIINKL